MLCPAHPQGKKPLTPHTRWIKDDRVLIPDYVALIVWIVNCRYNVHSQLSPHAAKCYLPGKLAVLSWSPWRQHRALATLDGTPVAMQPYSLLHMVTYCPPCRRCLCRLLPVGEIEDCLVHGRSWNPSLFQPKVRAHSCPPMT